MGSEEFKKIRFTREPEPCVSYDKVTDHYEVWLEYLTSKVNELINTVNRQQEDIQLLNKKLQPPGELVNLGILKENLK